MRRLAFCVQRAFYEKVAKPARKDWNLQGVMMCVGGSRMVKMGWDNLVKNDNMSHSFAEYRFDAGRGRSQARNVYRRGRGAGNPRGRGRPRGHWGRRGRQRNVVW